MFLHSQIFAMNGNLLQWQKLFEITICFSEVIMSGGHGGGGHFFFVVYINQLSHITYQAYIAIKTDDNLVTKYSWT